MDYGELIKSIEKNEIRGEYLLIIGQKEIKVIETDLIKQYIVLLDEKIRSTGNFILPIIIIFYVVTIWLVNAQVSFHNEFIVEVIQGWGFAIGLIFFAIFLLIDFSDLVCKRKAKSLNKEFMQKSKELGFTVEYLRAQPWFNENCHEVKAYIRRKVLTIDEIASRSGKTKKE